MLGVRVCVTTTAPLTHGSDEKAGNVSLCRRMPVSSQDGDISRVPVVSGNAFRGQLRRLLMRDMLDRVGIAKVSHDLYHTLFSGGALAKGDSPYNYPAAQIYADRVLVPSLGLFGASFRGHLLPSWLSAGIVWALCMETSPYLRRVYEHGRHMDSLPEARSLTSMTFLTRRGQVDQDIVDGKESESGDGSMIYEIESINTGVTMIGCHRIKRNATPQARGAFAHGLSLWIGNAQVGGKASIGHGAFDVNGVRIDYTGGCSDIHTTSDEIDKALDSESRPYVDHMMEHADAIRSWLVANGATAAQAVALPA